MSAGALRDGLSLISPALSCERVDRLGQVPRRALHRLIVRPEADQDLRHVGNGVAGSLSPLRGWRFSP